MSNLYEETINYLKHNGYTVMDVDYCSIMIDGHNEEVQFDFIEFEENSNFEYNEFGVDVEINMSLRIVFNDGTWLERWEEDGFEAWRHVTPPKKDVNKVRHGFINLRSPWQVKINESY